MLHDALAHARLYSSLTRPRLRMVLEALEDSMRGPLGEGQPCPRNLSVEHVMPQAWREHWGADIDGDEVVALRRDHIVHTLGNLTLVSGKLNPTLSNRPWADAEAGSCRVADGTEAVKRSQAFAPMTSMPRERVGHYWIDLARGWLLHGDRERALASLISARHTAPQQTRYHPMVHETVRMLARQDRRRSDGVQGFAAWCGIG